MIAKEMCGVRVGCMGGIRSIEKFFVATDKDLNTVKAFYKFQNNTSRLIERFSFKLARLCHLVSCNLSINRPVLLGKALESWI